MTMLNIVSLAAGAVAFAMSLVALHYARQNYKQAAERQQRTRNRRHGWVPATQDLPHRAPPPAVQPGVAVEFDNGFSCNWPAEKARPTRGGE